LKEQHTSDNYYFRWVYPNKILSLDCTIDIIKMRIDQICKLCFYFSVRHNRLSTYSRFLPVEVMAWGASVTSSPLSSTLERLLVSSLLAPLLLPRKRLPRSIVTYCKSRTVLMRQLYKALCIKVFINSALKS
jgi:hypothetical protein